MRRSDAALPFLSVSNPSVNYCRENIVVATKSNSSWQHSHNHCSRLNRRRDKTPLVFPFSVLNAGWGFEMDRWICWFPFDLHCFLSSLNVEILLLLWIQLCLKVFLVTFGVMSLVFNLILWLHLDIYLKVFFDYFDQNSPNRSNYV